MYNHSMAAIVVRHGPRSDAAYEMLQYPMPQFYNCSEVSFARLQSTYISASDSVVSVYKKHRVYPHAYTLLY